MSFLTPNGNSVELPLFIPVYRPDYSFDLLHDSTFGIEVRACIVNSFFLYKDKTKRTEFSSGLTLRHYLGDYAGMICTDSGAFQGLKRTLYLSNSTIVKFQNMIKADVIAPLDLITPPSDKRTVANDKMIVSLKRTKEALKFCDYSVLSGIQQGGRFFDLRQYSIRALAEIGFKYYGIGSLVPFFNRNHDLTFAFKVIHDARTVIGSNTAMHIYGAGDPLEIPFMFAAGANIFDSSSYAHFARTGYYMTPYGAINSIEQQRVIDHKCNCRVCRENCLSEVLSNFDMLQFHNLYTILRTIEDIRLITNNTDLYKHLDKILERHANCFPQSDLRKSWVSFIDEK